MHIIKLTVKEYTVDPYQPSTVSHFLLPDGGKDSSFTTAKFKYWTKFFTNIEYTLSTIMYKNFKYWY